MDESIQLSCDPALPQLTAEQAEQRRYLSAALLNKMHLMPTEPPVAYSVDNNGERFCYYDPRHVTTAPPERWLAPDPAVPLDRPIRLESGREIGKLSIKRAAAKGFYTRERLSQMHYDVVAEPVAYTLRNDGETVYFYDKKAAVRQPLMCTECGKEVRYRRKLCRSCYEADLALRRAEGDAFRNAEYHMKREKVIFFDLELTGVYDHDEIISVTIMDGTGTILMNTLVKPVHTKKWKRTEKIHGITPEMVADAPRLTELIPEIIRIFDSADAVIAYGIATDFSHIKYIYGTEAERNALRRKTRCAAAEYVRFIREHEPDQTHASLGSAMECLGVEWDGVAHTSIADTIGCAKVWEKLFPNYYDD